MVVVMALLGEEVSKHLSEDNIVWLLIKPQLPTIVEVVSKFLRDASGQSLNGSRHLFLKDQLVLVLFVHLGMPLQSLPGQSPFEEVH